MLQIKRVIILLCASAFMITACTCSWTNRKAQHESVLENNIKPPATSSQLYDEVIRHITYEKKQGNYSYPDSLIYAGVWFDFQGEADSLYVLGGPMSLPIETDDVQFLGYFKDPWHFISFAVLGTPNFSHIKQFIDIDALNINKEEYQKELDVITNNAPNVCAWWVSSFSFGPNQELILSNRRLRR